MSGKRAYDPGDTIIGQFEVLDVIEERATGFVYGARDLRLDEECALRFLPESATHDGELLDSVRQQIRTARTIRHQNVLAVHDLLKDEQGSFFVVMEWAKGGDLKQHVKEQGKLPWDRTKVILLELLRGLSAMHEAGLRHGHIDPSSVLLREDGTVALAPPGTWVAPRAGPVAEPVGDSAEARSAGAGPATIASEQSPASDLRGVGRIAYELLTGEPSFTNGLDPVPSARLLEDLDSHPLLMSVRVFVTRLLEEGPQAGSLSAVDAIDDLLYTSEAAASQVDQTSGEPPTERTERMAAVLTRTPLRVRDAVLLVGAAAVVLVAVVFAIIGNALFSLVAGLAAIVFVGAWVLACRPYAWGRTTGGVAYVLALEGSKDPRWPLDKQLLTIGRSAENDVVLTDTTVSGRHAKLYQQEGTWWIRDLGSRNGTYVNGRRVSRSRLGPGDRIALGESRLVFSKESKPRS